MTAEEHHTEASWYAAPRGSSVLCAQVGQLMLQSLYEERDSPPSTIGANGIAGSIANQPKELLDSLQSGDDRDAGAASSDPRQAWLIVTDMVGPHFSSFMRSPSLVQNERFARLISWGRFACAVAAVVDQTCCGHTARYCYATVSLLCLLLKFFTQLHDEPGAPLLTVAMCNACALCHVDALEPLEGKATSA